MFSVIAVKTIHSPDTLWHLDSVLQDQEQGGTVWSEKILSNPGAMSLCHWVLTLFLGEGGKVSHVHFTAYGEGDSQSFSKSMAKRMPHVLERDRLGVRRTWAARAMWGRCSLQGVPWIPRGSMERCQEVHQP